MGLADTGRPYMIIGGIAVIAHGVARLTRDVDATLPADGLNLQHLLVSLEKHAVRPRIPDAIDFAKQSQVLLMEHVPSGVEVDISLAWLPFELEALDAAVATELAGFQTYLARPEDLIVYKVAAWRPQDQQDVERLLELHGGSMDLVRIRDLAQQIATALEEPERAQRLNHLLEQAGLI